VFAALHLLHAREGLDWLSKTDRLSDDEIVRLAQVFIARGVTTIRLTAASRWCHPTLVPVVAGSRRCGRDRNCH